MGVDWLFYLLAMLTVLGSLGVLLLRNPIYSALSLAVTMIVMAALYFRLDAQFIAGVQLIVYAGAVMVLFVMVLMLFDLKHEEKTFSHKFLPIVVYSAAIGLIGGYIAIATYYSTDYVLAMAKKSQLAWNSIEVTRDVAMLLFSKYVFGFEAIGVLLLVIAIGVVALSRIQGGTHAKH